MRRGFQWFVAWRYLMARPRRASVGILSFGAGWAWLSIAALAAIGWYPLTDPLLPGPQIPLSVVLVGSFALALMPVMAAVVAVHYFAFARMRRLSGRFIGYAGLGAIITLATMGVYALYDAHISLVLAPDKLPIRPVLLTPGLAAAALFAVRAGVGLLRRIGLVRTQAGAKALGAMAWGLVLLQLLPIAALGVREVAAPTLVGTLSPVWVAVAAAVAMLAIGTAITALARLPRRPERARELFKIAAVCGLAAIAVIVISTWSAFADKAWDHAVEFGLDQPPMWLTITAAIAAAIAALAVILAVIRYIFTFFTTVSIGGVAIGTLALVVVLSVMSGFETDLRHKILGSNAHILITKNADKGAFTEYHHIEHLLDGIPGIVSHTPYLRSEVTIAAHENYANVIIKGVKPGSVGRVTDLASSTEEPHALVNLWPLGEDGIGHRPKPLPPPSTASAKRARAKPGGAGSAAPGVVDPPPADFDVQPGQPYDFAPPDAQAPPDGAARPRAPPPAAAGGGDRVVDPPPADFDVQPGQPYDFASPDAGAAAGEIPDELDAGDLGGAISPDTLIGSIADAAPPSPADQIFPEVGPIGTSPADTVGAVFEAAADELRHSRDIPPDVARLDGVLVGRELVKQLTLGLGEEVKMISPLADENAPEPVPRIKFARVAGTFYTGMYEYDLKYVYVTLRSLQDFLDLGDQVSGIEVRVVDRNNTGPVMKAIRAKIGPGYIIRDWKEINRSLFSALKLEKIAMFLVLAIIILVASFSIIGNLIMVVIEKAKEIALIKTLGASDGGVMKIFVVQGFFIGLVGMGVGVSLGLVVCWLLAAYGLPLNPDVYYIDRLPVHVDPLSVVAVAAAGIILSVVATIYPAFVGARLRPVEGLRYE